MIQRIYQSRLIQQFSGSVQDSSDKLVEWTKNWLIPILFRNRILGVVIIASLLATIYWGLIASDMYVSEAHIVIISTGASAPSGGGSLSRAVSGGGGASEFIAAQMWLRDYLLSVDMMEYLDSKLNLHSHYSNWHHDPISRMWSSGLEKFHDYYLSRIDAELDANGGDLVITAQAYNPKMAHAITSMLVEQGERYMNDTAQRMVEEQVSFLEKQVKVIKDQDIKARQTLLDFQNSTGLASPMTTEASIEKIINGLDSQRVSLQASRNAMLAYLMPDNPSILAIDQQISGIAKQIRTERARLVSPNGKPMNKTSDESMQLQRDVAIMDATYSAAVSAVETGRIMAAQMMKKVFVLQSPTMPQYPLEPRRLYNITVFILSMLILGGIAQLIVAIVRDHKD